MLCSSMLSHYHTTQFAIFRVVMHSAFGETAHTTKPIWITHKALKTVNR